MNDDNQPENPPVVVDQAVHQQADVPTVGTGNKEAGVLVQNEVQNKPEGFQIPKEVLNAGVEKIHEEPQLDKTHIDAGITHSDPPHPSVVSQSQIKAPLSEAEARVQDANPDKTRSQTWWGGLILKAIRKAFTKQSGPNTPIPNPI